jgi:hypothetical protein
MLSQTHPDRQRTPGNKDAALVVPALDAPAKTESLDDCTEQRCSQAC